MEDKNVIRKYEKPATKKHKPMNVVQGSNLYYSGSGGYSYSYTYYKVVLYYSH
jgi:hypothetical protein